MSPACLATYLTWLQAGRLKSPRDKLCSYSLAPFPSRQPSDNRLKVHIFTVCEGESPEGHQVFTVQPGANGILPDRMIAAMADAGLILPAYPFVESQIQPASLDLRLGDVAYRVRARFLGSARCAFAPATPSSTPTSSMHCMSWSGWSMPITPISSMAWR